MLKTVEKKRDDVKKHRDEKLTQMNEELDEGTTSDKIEQMQMYLQIVEEKLLSREKKVEEQKGKVKEAELAVEAAKKEVLQRQIDVEKLDIHKGEWIKEVKKEEAREARSLSDELGSAQFVRKKGKK